MGLPSNPSRAFIAANPHLYGPNASKSTRAVNPVVSTASNPGDQRIATVELACPHCSGKGCSSCAHGKVPRWMRDESAAMDPSAAPKPTLGVSAPALNKAVLRWGAPKLGKLMLTLSGQVRGGKNAMGVTKGGKHYARPAFKKWRAEMMTQINAQDAGGMLICEPTNIRVDYVSGDRKRRDQTGIFDALFHLLEYSQIVTDDSLLWVTESTRSYDKSAPSVTITFL